MWRLFASTWPTTSKPAFLGRYSSKREHRAGVDVAWREQAPLTQDRHDTFAEPVGLFEVRIAGENELAEAEGVILRDAIGDLFVRPHQRGAHATAHHADARPHVGMHDQP